MRRRMWPVLVAVLLGGAVGWAVVEFDVAGQYMIPANEVWDTLSVAYAEGTRTEPQPLGGGDVPAGRDRICMQRRGAGLLIEAVDKGSGDVWA